MSDIDELWGRIDEARRRLGLVDQAQIKQIEDLNERLKAIRDGLSGRYDLIERHRTEAERLRHENEQLRRMLHRLLIAIEERYGGRLKDILHDLESQVSSLVVMTGEGEETAPRQDPSEPTDTGGEACAKASDRPAAPGPDGAEAPSADALRMAAPPPPEEGPSETDSRWLREIMERARELGGDGSAAAPTALV